MLMNLKKMITWIMITVFFSSVIPLNAQKPPKPANLKGFVYLAEKKQTDKGVIQVTLTPIKDAIVQLRNEADNKEYRSEKTPDDGSYFFKNLPAGSFFPGIILGKKTYNVEGTIRLEPSEDVIISLYIEKDKPVLLPIKRGFFKSPWGIAALFAGTATAGLIIYNIVKKDEEVSPTQR